MEPIDNILDAIATTTARLLGYDFGAVLLAEDDSLLIRGSFGLATPYIEAFNKDNPIRLGRGLHSDAPASRAARA